MNKLWDPQVFNRVLDNWSENPFIDMILLDFTGEEYDEFWADNIKDRVTAKAIEDKMKCPDDYEEIG